MSDIRAGEELDLAKIDPWLKTKLTDLRGTAKVTQYSGGASNWTYRLEYENHDLVLRRPPAGTKAKSAHDMSREFKVQQALKPLFPAVPEMIAYCDESLLGVDFYVMRRIDGLIPRKQLPKEVPSDPAFCRKLCESLIDKLVELHQVDAEKAGLSAMGKGPGYPKRQIDGWSERYQKARTWNVPRFTYVMDWLKANTPTDVRQCVIHGDYRFDNVVLDKQDPSKIIGVLDWEMATIGDPLMDLGNSLAYWVEGGDDFLAKSLRRQPTHLPGMFTRREVVERYCSKMGLKADGFTFYEVYGNFRLAVIAQQIYYRYFHKQTRNPAFKRFWLFIHYLHYRCRRLIRQAR
ncbi:MAG: phosphotransferase family protein [Myxococcaceae bacterium]